MTIESPRVRTRKYIDLLPRKAITQFTAFSLSDGSPSTSGIFSLIIALEDRLVANLRTTYYRVFKRRVYSLYKNIKNYFIEEKVGSILRSKQTEFSF